MNKINVLDHGFVRLVDYMGNDAAICQAARVSYGNGTKSKQDDENLIRYLMRYKHTSPFEMVEFKFHCKMPIFVARQWVRHRTASLNEISGRYSKLPAEWYVPELKNIKSQSINNKQGREDDLGENIADEFQIAVEDTGRSLFDQYEKHLEQDVSRELARINLPLSTYTEWYWKIDLHNLFHFLKLRMDSHAQWEIQEYAKVIFVLINTIVPVSCKAFEDYILNSSTFSYEELNCIRSIIEELRANGEDEIINFQIEEAKLSKRELEEFKKKLGI